MILSLEDLPRGGDDLSSGFVEVSGGEIGMFTAGSLGGRESGDGGGRDSSLSVECTAMLPRLDVSERKSSDEPSLLMRSGLLSLEDFLL